MAKDENQVEKLDPLDVLTDINLKRIQKKGGSMYSTDFVDENGNRLIDNPQGIKSEDLAEYMNDEGLISVDGEMCKLEKLGKYVMESAGSWISFSNTISEQKEEEFAHKALIKKKDINHSRLIGLQLKTFWWIFGFAVFGTAYSIYDIVKNLTMEEVKVEKGVTQEELKSEIHKLRTLILEKKAFDSLPSSKKEIDSTKS